MDSKYLNSNNITLIIKNQCNLTKIENKIYFFNI